MRELLLAAALGLAAPALAQVPPPPHPACQGDPRCEVVPPNDVRLKGDSAGQYNDVDDKIYLSEQAIQKGDCAKYLYEHENYHRRQYQRGEGKNQGNVWAEQDAQQNAPTYNCGKGPNGTLRRY